MRSGVAMRKSFFTMFFLAGAIYLLLVSGGVFPYAQDDQVKSAIKGAMLFVAGFYLSSFGIGRSAFRPVGAFLFIGLTIGCVALGRSEHLGFSLEKIDGAIVCSAVIALLLDRAYSRFGERAFHEAFIAWAFCLLLLTLGYKAQFGLFDRDVRYFLNGPIVYGWLMGVCGVISFHLWSETRRRIFLIAFVLFFIALIWTESKGSVFGFAVGMAFYLLMNFKKSLVLSLGTVGCFLIFNFFFADQILELLDGTRFSAIGRIYSGELSEADDGSVGTRVVLVEKAFQDFKENPLSGIGLGQFSLGEYRYPHNQHLEIFAEMGVFVGLLHVFFVLFSFWRATLLNRAIILIFAVGASFSGDISYLRFLYSFCLIGIVSGGSGLRNWKSAEFSNSR
ncbi:O-antigen ligase [Variovorax boronicumulans]|uniref:O-antigen ligase n=1 Tax=Variovorax boronicumulans TaxID=436515 RepID=A0AAW8E4F8_9BURK|nr:O-antigen ligase family protein [Variovorax boronicumulans]MDP9881376.1 O-antigen ligase [Variovorax boronicumulans]MDP9926663.1 O-antigen ligase [Variovorax boronicumulans]